MTLLKSDIKEIAKFFSQIEVNDIDCEELANELQEKSEDYFEKGKDERAEAYQEVAEAFVEFAEAYQNLYSTLCDHEVVND